MIESVPLLFGGEWRATDGVATSPVFNPSTGEVIAETPMCGPKEADAAVQAAATELWNAELAKLNLVGASDSQQRQLYTAMYHIMLMPTDRTGENPAWKSSGEPADLQCGGESHDAQAVRACPPRGASRTGPGRTREPIVPVRAGREAGCRAGLR